MKKLTIFILFLCTFALAYSQNRPNAFFLSCTVTKVGQNAPYSIDFMVDPDVPAAFFNNDRTGLTLERNVIRIVADVGNDSHQYESVINRNTGGIQIFPYSSSTAVATGKCQKTTGKLF